MSPPVNNTNYAWIQHFLHHLSPADVADFVMAKTTRNTHSCSVTINEDVRKYAVQEEALKQSMEAKSKEFVEKGRGGLRESLGGKLK